MERRFLEILCVLKKRGNIMELDFAIMISVTFFSDKRNTPPYLHNYRPHLVVKNDNEYLGVCFIEGSACEFNEAVSAIVLPVYEDVHYNKLTINTPFFVMEGPNIVGEGVVEDIFPHIPYEKFKSTPETKKK